MPDDHPHNFERVEAARERDEGFAYEDYRPSLADEADEEIVECEECGHLHYEVVSGTYIDCPLSPECDCEGQP